MLWTQTLLSTRVVGVVQIKVTFWVEYQNLKALANKDLKDLLSSKSVTLIPRFLNHAAISGHRTLAALERYLGVTEQQKDTAISTLDF